MGAGVGVLGLYGRDQQQALAFYVGTQGLSVHTDAGQGAHRWPAVQHPGQPSFHLVPGPPARDAGFRDPSGNGWKPMQASG